MPIIEQINEHVAPHDFKPDSHPEVDAELQVLISQTAHLLLFRGDIIISFMKDHMIKKEWVDSNPELTRLITTGALRAQHVERLFESYRNDRPSLMQAEDYVYQKLRAGIRKEASIL